MDCCKNLALMLERMSKGSRTKASEIKSNFVLIEAITRRSPIISVTFIMSKLAMMTITLDMASFST